MFFFNNATILLLIATLGHAGNTIAAKLAINDVSTMVIVSFRWGLVASILFFVKKKSIKSSFRMMKKHLLWVLLMGGIGLSGFSALFYTAPNYTSVINIGIIQCTMPAFVLIGSFAEALYKASLAICSDTPSTSNKIRPGFTRHA